MKRLLLKLLPAFLAVAAHGQTITVKDAVCRTYPFSDPDPVPQTSGIYPYSRFGSFSLRPCDRTWKMVVLENDWLRVKIFPEIGGKIWSVYDKVHHKELFYDNDVVKFREIALRGPWTSGGIEFNYGVIGHAPSCSHPVDYRTEYRKDGGVSCYIGVSELLTRTRWTVEITLPKDAVRVRTRSFWHNSSGMYQPYYSWTNAGVEVNAETRIICPGSRNIGHDGVASAYPIDEQGHDLTDYAAQAFGDSKSFHVIGTHRNFFGAYWKKDDCGMLHYALRDEKAGRKYFSWSQAASGEIWVDLLTDTRPQYIELQSGRLLNQNLPESVRTPYKQILFQPYATDVWTEYWLPFGGIGEADDLTLKAAVHVEAAGADRTVGIFPIETLSGKLTLSDEDGRELASTAVHLRPAETFKKTFSFPPGVRLQRISLDGFPLWSADPRTIRRPDSLNEDFSLDSPQGQMIYARYLYGTRRYREAEEKADRALKEAPSLIPALNLKAALCLKSARYAEALRYSDKTLAIDTYDSQANYLGGLAAMNLGRKYDAMDRFEIAAISPDLRSAAHTCLACLYFMDGMAETAADYARKSLVGNARNLTAYQILQQIEPSEETLERIAALDPLSHFPDMERMLSGKISVEELNAGIREEMAGQNHLEAAVFYHRLGLDGKALKVLEACPLKDYALVKLWLAYLRKDVSAISVAEEAAIGSVFPFREESVEALQWAVAQGGGGHSRYLLAMLVDFLGDKERALSLIAGLETGEAPFYSYRATLSGAESDFRRAVELDPEQWRYRQNLALRYYGQGRYEEALALVERYFRNHRDNFHIGDTYVKTLIALQRYAKAEQVLEGMVILPFEGQTGTHVMYRDIKLHLAAGLIDKGKYGKALEKIAEAKLWPESLGVGKPYDERIDTVPEDWLEAVVRCRQGDQERCARLLDRVRKAERDGKLLPAFEKAVKKDRRGKYAEVLPMLGNLDASYDRKLF